MVNVQNVLKIQVVILMDRGGGVVVVNVNKAALQQRIHVIKVVSVYGIKAIFQIASHVMVLVQLKEIRVVWVNVV